MSASRTRRPPKIGSGNRVPSQAVIDRTPSLSTETPEERTVRLFRTEALSAQQTHWLGTVLLTPRPSDHLFAAGAMVAVLAIAALLSFGQFTRKARVNGWLVPQQGLVRVFAPQPGVVTALYVREGSQVRKGQRLLTLSSELESATLGATQAQVVRRLTELTDSLRKERQEDERLLTQQQRTYTERLAALHAELRQIGEDIATMRARVALAERNSKVNRSLKTQGYVSAQQLEVVEADRLEQREKLGTLQRQQIELQREAVTLDGELRDLPVKTQAAIAAIDRNMATAEQELAQAEARRAIVISAPQDGTVTAILVEQGGHADVSAPLFSIVPTGAQLEAHLYGPSRAIGFVHPG